MEVAEELRQALVLKTGKERKRCGERARQLSLTFPVRQGGATSLCTPSHIVPG
jgi:hypothetical protein